MNMSTKTFKSQPYRRKYLKDYFARMSKDNTAILYDDNVASVLKEQGYEIPESPRSIYRVDKLFEGLYKFESGSKTRISVNSEKVQPGIALARACFAKPKSEKYLEPLPFTVTTIEEITSNRSGSSGLTAWGQTKAESFLRAYQRGVETIKGKKKPEPCIAFTRTQFNDKTRLVWGYPFSMTAIEALFARPLIEKFLSRRTPMAFGLTTLNIGCRLRSAAYKNKFAYSTDYSAYDSTISKDLIRIAFNILRTWFQLDELEPTTNVSYFHILKLVENYFINTTIVMPDGNIYYGKDGGIPSGSYLTQIVGSIINTILIGSISHEFALNVNKRDLLLLGDDVLFWSNRRVNMDHIASFLLRVFGIVVNVDKSGFYTRDEAIKFLGRNWENGIPTLDEVEVLKRMAFVERFRKYSKEKVKRDREVRMLLFSYASVYRSAFKIYMNCLGNDRRYQRTNSDFEIDVFSLGRGSLEFENIDPDKLSGLQRYYLKYAASRRRTTSPLALQFLK